MPLNCLLLFFTKICNQVDAIFNIINAKDWSFSNLSFEYVICTAKEGDLIYCDPPYYGRYVDYFNGWTENDEYKLAGGVAETIPEDAPFYVKDYFAYYKTPRGYHPRSLNSNGGWNVTSSLSFLNMPILSYAGEITSAVLVIHGEKAHSLYFSRDAFAKLKGENKELLIIPGAVHTDLYDNTEVIPFDKIRDFFVSNLK